MEIKQNAGEKAGEFYIEEDGELLAEMIYKISDDNVLTIEHTTVDKKLQGQGIGRKLVDEAIAYADSKNYKLNATCSYAKHILDKIKDN